MIRAITAGKFQLGELVATPGALEVLQHAGISPLALLVRHANGDYGDLDDDDKAANEAALVHGGRIFSGYETSAGRLWVITEATMEDGTRRSTCILRPDEY